MRWLVSGAGGMLGTDLVSLLRQRGHEVSALTRAELDITDRAACEAAARDHDIVVNCAAYTAVDAAEDESARAFAVNAVGAGHLAWAAHRAGAAVVQVSTDYVFAGDATTPYAADAAPAPAQVYGRSKLAGEWAVRAECPRSWVVRTAWLYGAHGPSFPRTIARLAREHDTVSVVTDEIGQPTWTVDLADGIERLVAVRAPFGIWHGTSSGECSRHDLARAVLEEIGLDPDRITRTDSAAFPRPAARPAYSVLSHAMWTAHGIAPLRSWRVALRAAASSVLSGS